MSSWVERSWLLAGVLAGLGASTGCGKEHPPFIEDLAGSSEGGNGGRGSVAPSTTAGADGSSGAPNPTLPGDALGSFDADQVYVWGTLLEGAGYRDAISNVDSPNTYLLGFSDSPNGATAQISQGRLLYQLVFDQGIRAFVPDLQSTLKVEDVMYPQEPLRNDPILATPPCLAEDDGPSRFMVRPNGGVVYLCPDEVWYEDGEAVFDQSDVFDDVVAFGDSLALLDQRGHFAVVDLTDGQVHVPDDPEPSFTPVALRATNDGFHVVKPSSTGNNAPELWNIAADGSAERLYIYEQPPTGVDSPFGGKLTRSDELYEQARADEAFTDVIIRRTTGGASDVVYTEADEPRVLLHISYLFTGP